MAKLKWIASPWGLERGNVLLEFEQCSAIEDGEYPVLSMIIGSRTMKESGEFVTRWRELMEYNRCPVDEDAFRLTVGLAAGRIAKRTSEWVFRVSREPELKGYTGKPFKERAGPAIQKESNMAFSMAHHWRAGRFDPPQGSF